MPVRPARPLSRFCRDTDGAITAEFVIIFPLVMLLIFPIVFVSLLIATTSEVQQVAHELARATFRYFDPDAPTANLCGRLRAEILPALIDHTLTLGADKLTLQGCPVQPEAGGLYRITVTVTYNFAGSAVQALGENFGLDVGIITRSSMVQM